MLREYDLRDPVLERIARAVDKADTVQDVMLEPAATGLNVLCQGIRLISPGDRVALVRIFFSQRHWCSRHNKAALGGLASITALLDGQPCQLPEQRLR